MIKSTGRYLSYAITATTALFGSVRSSGAINNLLLGMLINSWYLNKYAGETFTLYPDAAAGIYAMVDKFTTVQAQQNQ